MADKKVNLIPRLEISIILVFFLSFLIWAASKCNRTSASLQATTAQEGAEVTASTEEANARVDSAALAELAARAAARNPNPTRIESTTSDDAPKAILFVVIDDLNLRTEPDLKSDVIDRLPLFTAVEYLQERTDFTTELKLSETILVNEPWLKVRSPKGREGWVYGAGVDYHKAKYPGL
jgi:hypothetical protein